MWWAQQEGNRVSFKCPGNKINFKDAINKKYRNGAYYWIQMNILILLLSQSIRNLRKKWQKAKKTKSPCCNPVLRTQYPVFYDWYCQGCDAKVTRIARIEEYSSLKQINAKQWIKI